MLRNIFCLCFCLLSSVVLFGQKKLKSGTITYTLIEVESSIPELRLMEGSEMKLYFTPEKSKTEIRLMQGLVGVSVISESKKNEKVYLYDLMDSKYRLQSDTLKQQSFPTPTELRYAADTLKILNGYTCQKVNYQSGKEGAVMWVTNRIKNDSEFFAKAFAKVKGFPLEFTLPTEKAKLTFQVSEIIPNYPDLNIDSLPEDYLPISEKEFAEKTGGIDFGLGLF